jgi:hypothetical protein
MGTETVEAPADNSAPAAAAVVEAPAPAPFALPGPAEAEPPATPEAAVTPEQSDLFLLSGDEAAEAAGDPGKVLTPEEREAFEAGLRRDDYTRKTQALADERRTFLSEKESWLRRLEAEVLARRGEQDGSPDPFAKIRELRELGNHEDADKLLWEMARSDARKEMDPLIRQTESQNRQSAFVNIAVSTATADPVVKMYAKDVSARFDGDEVIDPRTGVTMKDLRQAIMTDVPTMKKFVPLVMRAIALESHANRLEKELKNKIKVGIQTGLAAEKARARAVPSNLIPTSGAPRMSGISKMTLDEALSAAIGSN